VWYFYLLFAGIKYIFGTSFDETHKSIAESDLAHAHYGPDTEHDIADRSRGKTREQVLHEQRIGQLDLSKGPRPFGWFGESLHVVMNNYCDVILVNLIDYHIVLMC
jgi:hypothetical protein